MSEHLSDELAALLLGEASREVVLAAAAHLPGCADCQQELATAVIAHASLRSAARFAPEVVASSARADLDVEPPPSLPDLSAVFAQVRHEVAQAQPPRSGHRSRRKQYILAAAAAVVIAVGAGTIITTTSGPDTSSTAFSRDIRLAAFDAGSKPATARITGTQLTINATSLPHLVNRRYEVWLTDRTRTHLQPVGWISVAGRARLTVPPDLMGHFTDIEVSVQKVDSASYDYSGISVLRGSYR